MLPPELDLEHRKPVWQALSCLFLDTELQETDYRHIAQTILASGYAPAEVETILWDEVFPAVECNVRNPAGEWIGFDTDWLQERILSPDGGCTIIERLIAKLPVIGSASIIRKEWAELLQYFPDDFRAEKHAV
jgi:hypothetical protein